MQLYYLPTNHPRISVYDIIENNRNHFLGAIIYTMSKNGRIIIDGQQRLTSLSLLFVALRDSIENKTIKVGNDQLTTYLDLLLYETGTKNPLLEPVYKDKEAYNNLLTHGTRVEDSNIVRNYDLFMRYIGEASAKKYDAMTLYNAAIKMWFMPISLDCNEGDDPQAVFESINTTGLSLSDADCIRNYILMNRDVNEQNRIYKKYWYEIEHIVGDATTFFRDYLTAISTHLVNMDDVYSTFKKTYPDIRFDSEKIDSELKEILIYAKIYRTLLDSDKNETISKTFHYMLNNVNHMDLSVVYPFLLNVLRDHEPDRQVLTTSNINEIAIILNDYLIRRSAAGFLSTGLNNIMESLYRNTMAQEGDGDFVEKLKYVIISKSSTLKYPNDKDLRESLNKLNLYKKKKLCDVVLTMIEYYNKDQPYLLNEINVKGGRSIEHIMPQELSDEWEDYLGDGAESFYNEWDHRIGNLTLTSYNGEYSNRPYPEKWSMPNGLGKNTLFLNSTLTPEFKQEQLIKRNEWMIDRLIVSMPYLTTTYKPPSHVEEIALGSIESAADLNEKKVFGFRMDDAMEEDCTSIKDTLLKLIKSLYSNNQECIDAIPETRIKGLSSWLKHEESDGSVKLNEDLYLSYSNTHGYFDFTKRLLKFLNADPYDVVLLCKPKK